MTSDYSSSGASDLDIMEAQSGARKRRRLSPTKKDISSESEEEIPKKPISFTSRIAPRAQKAVVSAPATAPLREDKTSFASINVAPWLVSSLSSMEIKKPTGIQKACIPEILKGRDCIGGSRTGTGKTVAFAVPILQKWAEDPCGIFAVIIT